MKNKAGMILISIAIAFALWYYVISTVSPNFEQNYYGVKVNFENESVLMDRDLMLVSSQTPTVSMRLNGNRSDLSRLPTSSIIVTVDLGTIYEPGKYEKEYRVSVPAGYGSVSVAKRLISTVSVEVVEYESKQVPVQMVFSGELEDGLVLDQEEASLGVSFVTVSGPRSEVDQVSYAGIEIDREDLKETLSQDFVYTLMNESFEPVDVEHITTDTGEIHVFLPVEHIKEIPLRVELVAGGGADEEHAAYTVEPGTIMISGSQEALDRITELVVATVDLSNVDLRKEFSEDVELRLPENVTNRSNISTAHLEVTLSGLVMKNLIVSRDRIRVLNVPDGLDAIVYTQQMEVVLRGPASQLSGLTADHVTVTVDMANESRTTVTLAPTITVDGKDKVGAFGKYTVTVGLVPHVEPEPEETVSN